MRGDPMASGLKPNDERRDWRRTFTRKLDHYRWHVLGAAAIVAFVLGCIGLWEYWETHGDRQPPGATDLAYGSLKLFLLSAPEVPHLPVTLDIARFLAPAVFGWAGLSALGTVIRDRLQQMRIPAMDGHVVICGLGYVGRVFVEHVRDAGDRVVVIEMDPANPNIKLCRDWRVPVITGDARLERTLDAAGVRRASRLLAVCPRDGVNADIVAVARKAAAGRREDPLHCLARIADPGLCEGIRIEQSRRSDSPVKIDFFNTDDVSARALLDTFPIEANCRTPHILVAHLDALGEALVWHAARDWYDKRPSDCTAPLFVTVVDDEAVQRVDDLKGRSPALEKVCHFTTYGTAVADIRGLSNYLTSAPALNDAFVTAYRDEQTLETAMKLRHVVNRGVRLVIALSRTHGVASLEGDDGTSSFSKLTAFHTLDSTCTDGLVRGGSFEVIARAIHRHYVDEERRRGKDAKPWEGLEKSLKESNRAQARHIHEKLHAVGCEIAPLRDWYASEFRFSDAELEKLAHLEHERWVNEREADGWTSGVKNVALKTTPYLVPFEQLSKDVADYDRLFVRAIPKILASVGLQVIRTHRS